MWALGYFPHHDDYATSREQMENSYLGKLGKTIEPVMAPCGFDWRQSVSLLTGVAAKEVVASTMGVLYASAEENAIIEEEGFESDDGSLRISRLVRNNMTPLSAASMLLFILLYMPCLSAVVAIKNESGKWRWAIFTMVYTIALAWVVSFAFFQIGSLLL